MELVANILLAFGATGAGIYCWVLSRKIRRLNSLENGMGSAIAVLSVQVDDLKKALAAAGQSAAASEDALRKTAERAEAAAAQLETQFAALEVGETSRQPRRHVRVQRSRQNLAAGAARYE